MSAFQSAQPKRKCLPHYQTKYGLNMYLLDRVFSTEYECDHVTTLCGSENIEALKSYAIDLDQDIFDQIWYQSAEMLRLDVDESTTYYISPLKII